jgi:hypothetical protein
MDVRRERTNILCDMDEVERVSSLAKTSGYEVGAHFAGRLETGKQSFTDPSMGGGLARIWNFDRSHRSNALDALRPRCHR